MNYHRWDEPEQAMHSWLVLSWHEPLITADFCHPMLFHERGKQYFMQPFFRWMKLHTCFNYTSHWSYELNFSRLWMSIMHGLAWSEFNYCTWFALSVSSLPLSVMLRSCHSCVNLRRLRSSGFTPMLHSGSSPSPTRQRAGISHAQNFQRTFGLMKYLNTLI